MDNFERLSINQYTTREQWSLAQAIEGYARHGIRAMAVDSLKLRELGVAQAAKMLREHQMAVSGYCIGGLLTDHDPSKFRAEMANNRRVIDEAAEIGAQCVVFVAGGLTDGSKDIEGARERCLDGLAELIPHAQSADMVLALEPLHPMTGAFRSVLMTLRQANDWVERLGGASALGILLDVYHVWWEPDLAAEIKRAAGRIVGFHVSDFLMDTTDIRLDRGMMGDGVIDIPRIRGMVEATGYDGLIEVEIFSARDWWQRDPNEVVEVVKERYLAFV